jgi:hypothetical protein
VPRDLVSQGQWEFLLLLDPHSFLLIGDFPLQSSLINGIMDLNPNIVAL